MKIVKVTYRVQPSYVEHNQANISKVMADLQQLNYPGMRYVCVLGSDGQTFMHFAMFTNEEAEQQLFQLESFKHFQQELKSSAPETPPVTEKLSLVGSSYTIFEN